MQLLLLFLVQMIPRGVARDVDFQGITYNTLFLYLESHEDPNDWIIPLVLFLITQGGDFGTLLRFRASEDDTPFSAAVRFCVLTGKVMLCCSLCRYCLFLLC